MAISPAVRSRYEMADDPTVLDAFLLPDAVVFIGGSSLAAIGARRGTSWSAFAAAVTAGRHGVRHALPRPLDPTNRRGGAGLTPMALSTAGSTFSASRLARRRSGGRR